MSCFLFRPKIKIIKIKEKNEESKIGNSVGENPFVNQVPRNRRQNSFCKKVFKYCEQLHPKV